MKSEVILGSWVNLQINCMYQLLAEILHCWYMIFSAKSCQSCGSNMLKRRVDGQNPCWDSQSTGIFTILIHFVPYQKRLATIQKSHPTFFQGQSSRKKLHHRQCSQKIFCRATARGHWLDMDDWFHGAGGITNTWEDIQLYIYILINV